MMLNFLLVGLDIRPKKLNDHSVCPFLNWFGKKRVPKTLSANSSTILSFTFAMMRRSFSPRQQIGKRGPNLSPPPPLTPPPGPPTHPRTTTTIPLPTPSPSPPRHRPALVLDAAEVGRDGGGAFPANPLPPPFSGGWVHPRAAKEAGCRGGENCRSSSPPQR